MNAIVPDLHCQFGLPLAEVESSLVQRFHVYWQDLKRGDHPPSRADIEPADIKHLLPHILLVDIEPELFRVRYRVCGTHVADMCGDVTGEYLDELDGGSVWSPSLFQQQYKLVCERRVPIFGRQWVLTRFDTRHPCLIGIWPLAKNGRDVDMCIAIADYLELRPEQLGNTGPRVSRAPTGNHGHLLRVERSAKNS
jgi:hypothetical protein